MCQQAWQDSLVASGKRRWKLIWKYINKSKCFKGYEGMKGQAWSRREIFEASLDDCAPTSAWKWSFFIWETKLHVHINRWLWDGVETLNCIQLLCWWMGSNHLLKSGSGVMCTHNHVQHGNGSWLLACYISNREWEWKITNCTSLKKSLLMQTRKVFLCIHM